MNKKLLHSVILLVLAFIIVVPHFVLAGTTGRLTGKVVNEETGEPIPGVAVSVVGTKMGALTNEDGEYTIINVPVGTYTLRASIIGFAPVEITNAMVSVDLATYIDFTLSRKALELGKTIVVRAERPLILKDKTTSVAITTSEKLQAMPVRGFEQVVGIQNSVVRMNSNVDIRQRGGRESLAMAPEINLRGGRPSEVAYYVDGFSQQDPLSGISTANIANNAIQEVAVTSGAFSAEYGHVASGIVNVTTRSGGEIYHGNLELVSDNVASIFGYDSYDQNWYSADLSGPIPGLDKAFFFFSGERRFLADRTPSVVTDDVYKRFGLDSHFEEPQRLPANSLRGWSYQGKLDFQLTQNMKLSVNGNGSYDRWQEYRHYYLNPAFVSQVEHSPYYVDKNLGLNAKITHQLNPNTFYNFSISSFLTERTRGDGKVFEDYNAYERKIEIRDYNNRDSVVRVDVLANPEYDVHNLFREGDSLFYSDIYFGFPDSLRGTEADSFVTFIESFWANYLQRKSSYYGVKGDITSQVTPSNTVKFGFDFQRHTLRYFENLNATQDHDPTKTTERLNRYGYDLAGDESDNESFKNDTKHPINLGIYVQDRFEWRGLILNGGLRYDYFDYKALRLKNIYRPFDASNVGDSRLDITDLEDSKAFTRLSPRLGVSFPVSDKTQLYFNFGKFYQRPDLVRLYTGYDFLEARVTAGSYYPFPSPNLEPEMTTQYEFGLTHQLGENTAVELTAYYKDVSDLTQIYHLDGVFPKAYDFFANADYGTIKGFDFNLTMRRTRNLALDLKYSLSYATGTGSYAQSTFNIAWKNPQGTPKRTNPLDYDQRHSIIGVIDFRTVKGEGPVLGNFRPLENFGASAIVQIGSGTPYTPMQIYDGVSPNASVQQIPTGPINSANLPWQFTVDVKAERTVRLGNFNLVPYIWIKNLLNRENVLAVYEGTGKGYTSGYLETPEGQVRASAANTGEEFAYRYNLGQNNPKNYSIPRLIYFGLRMSF